MKKIHPTAIVAPGVVIGSNVTIGQHVVINSPHVILEDGVTIQSHAYIDGYTTIGAGTLICHGVCIGTKAQDLKYRGEKTLVKVGKKCIIRECATINSSSQENSVVEVGDQCIMMPFCHIAHNCLIGNRVIMSNHVALSGYVEIEDSVFIGRMTGIHQFVRIGRYARVETMSGIPRDIPPYTTVSGIPSKFGGLDMMGLKRHGFPQEIRQELSKAVKFLYHSRLHLNEALVIIEMECKPFPEIEHFVQFCRKTKRGIMGLQERLEEISGADLHPGTE